MSYGAVLVQPQKVRRAAGIPPDFALVQDFLELMVRVVEQSDHGGAIFQALIGALEGTVKKLEEHLQTASGSAPQRLVEWLQPAIDFAGSIAESPAALSDGQNPLELARSVLLKLSETAGTLTLDQLRTQIALLLDIVQNDLGLTPDFIEQQVWELFDEMIARLEAPGGDAATLAERMAAASVFRRVKRRIRDQVKFPQLKADEIANRLFELLKGSGIGGVASKAACMTGQLAGAMDAGLAVNKLVEDVIAKAKPSNPYYCWYATWLLGDKDRSTAEDIFAAVPLPFTPEPRDDIWIDQGFLRRGNANPWGGNASKWKDPITKEEPVSAVKSWEQLPIFTDSTRARYYLSRWKPSQMEGWAFHTAWSADLLRMIFHLTSIEEGDYASNVSYAVWYAFQTLFEVITRSPFKWWLPVKKTSDTYRLPVYWAINVPKVLIPFLASIQGAHTKASGGNRFLQYMTLLLANAGENFLTSAVIDTIRNLTLSTLTLWNTRPTKEEKQALEAGGRRRLAELTLNSAETSGFVMAVAGGLSTLVLGLAFDRKEYAHPFQDRDVSTKDWMVWNIGFYTLLIGITGPVLGALGAWAIAGMWNGEPLLKQIRNNMILNFLMFWYGLYSAMEGDTDHGKYNPKGADFHGYPPKSSSPYTLPYPEGRSYLVGQANQGMWSHNNAGPSQVYAFDFGFDFEEEVVASRPGTVTEINEDIPNNSSEAWNNIEIRHDLDDNLAPLTELVADHDVGPGGAYTVTFGVYGHGCQYSITKVFQQREPGIGRLVTWSVSMDVTFGQYVIQPIGGKDNLFRCMTAGKTGATPPAWASATFNDGTVVWKGEGEIDKIAWAKNSAVMVNQVVEGTVGGQKYLFQCATAGTTGDPEPTWGERGNFRDGSVVWANMARKAIPGAKVRRGNVIMLADSTGKSFYNHLHMQVRAETQLRTGPKDTSRPFAEATIDSNYTIPFVYKDVSSRVEFNRLKFTGDDGVPYHLDYYTSSTKVVT